MPEKPEVNLDLEEFDPSDAFSIMQQICKDHRAVPIPTYSRGDAADFVPLSSYPGAEFAFTCPHDDPKSLYGAWEKVCLRLWEVTKLQAVYHADMKRRIKWPLHGHFPDHEEIKSKLVPFSVWLFNTFGIHHRFDENGNMEIQKDDIKIVLLWCEKPELPKQ